jgi:hypothetical protein
MPTTLESLTAATIANQVLVIIMVKMSGMAPQIKRALEIDAAQMLEVGQGTASTDVQLAELRTAFDRLLGGLSDLP